jgi:heme exporter protein D
VNWPQFFAMGGYGAFVWSSYALAAVVLALNLIVPLAQRRRTLAKLREYYRVQGRPS